MAAICKYELLADTSYTSLAHVAAIHIHRWLVAMSYMFLGQVAAICKYGWSAAISYMRLASAVATCEHRWLASILYMRLGYEADPWNLSRSRLAHVLAVTCKQCKPVAMLPTRTGKEAASHQEKLLTKAYPATKAKATRVKASVPADRGQAAYQATDVK
eukprot:360178-Chlamydomonas_euryale.AAC.3